MEQPIRIWRDELKRTVRMEEGEHEFAFTPDQWRFICRCVDQDLLFRLDDALRLVRILKDKQKE